MKHERRPLPQARTTPQPLPKQDVDRDQPDSGADNDPELTHNVDLMMRLAENALVVADSLRESYFANTATFVRVLRAAMRAADTGQRATPLLVHDLQTPTWPEFRGEAVAFIDGGVGQVRLASQTPILVRVGSYCVRLGVRDLTAREDFGYYPVILGQVEGGSRDRSGFPDLVRMTAELLSGLSALERLPDLRMLMFHGPLVSLVGLYTGHAPFTEHDIDLFLQRFAPNPAHGRQLKQAFLAEAAQRIYPAMTDEARSWAAQHLFEPLAWLAFLYRHLIERARRRTPIPLIAGVVERGQLREFTETVLLQRVFAGLRAKGNLDYFNRMYGRADLTSPRALLDRLGYTDSVVLSMLLHPGHATESWRMAKYGELGRHTGLLSGGALGPVTYAALKPGPLGFPDIQGCYVAVSDVTEPIRVETFEALGADQVTEAARRAYLYARLLPGYGFPVGLDIVDKYACVPTWLTTAYAKLIRHHLGVSLQRGEVDDAEMQRILVQALYMRQRDWLFRPQVLEEAHA